MNVTAVKTGNSKTEIHDNNANNYNEKDDGDDNNGNFHNNTVGRVVKTSSERHHCSVELGRHN